MKHFFQKHFQALKRSENHWLRKSIGVLLVIGGVLGFLPILGYWMFPLGLALLAIDFPAARRLHRRLTVGWERLRRRITSTGSRPKSRDRSRRHERLEP